MYIFEGVYTNTETDETITKPIEFDAAPTCSYEDAFIHATISALQMQTDTEELYEVRNVCC